jgi:uncharacterized membrane protein
MTDSFFEHEAKGEPSGKVPELDDKVADGASAGSTREDSFTTEEGRMAAIMSYIPILCFIPLLSMKENKEAHFHARQGVVLFLIELIAVIFLIDGISSLVFKGILILAVALSIAGIYFALQGKNYRLPVISDLAEKTKVYTEPEE